MWSGGRRDTGDHPNSRHALTRQATRRTVQGGRERRMAPRTSSLRQRHSRAALTAGAVLAALTSTGAALGAGGAPLPAPDAPPPTQSTREREGARGEDVDDHVEQHRRAGPRPRRARRRAPIRRSPRTTATRTAPAPGAGAHRSRGGDARPAGGVPTGRRPGPRRDDDTREPHHEARSPSPSRSRSPRQPPRLGRARHHPFCVPRTTSVVSDCRSRGSSRSRATSRRVRRCSSPRRCCSPHPEPAA